MIRGKLALFYRMYHKGPKPQDGYRSEAYSFDSSALERAAKAAKELEKSKFATQALDLSKQQEVGYIV